MICPRCKAEAGTLYGNDGRWIQCGGCCDRDTASAVGWSLLALFGCLVGLMFCG